MALTNDQRKNFAKKQPAPPPAKDNHKGPRPESADDDEYDDQEGDDEDEYDNEDEGNEGEDTEPGDDFQEGGEGKYGHLIPVIEMHAQDIEACCDELDTEYLTDTTDDMPDDEKQILTEGVDALADDLKSALGAVSGISQEDAQKLAAHLAEEDIIEDEDRVAGWLVRVGQVL